jgi:ParB family chromosome partitioning protein
MPTKPKQMASTQVGSKPSGHQSAPEESSSASGIKNLALVPINDLTLDPANVRRHPAKNVEAIKASLQRFGQQRPVLINSKGIVIAGNGTVMAAKALGWEQIKVVRTDLAGSEATAFAIADNRTSELAEWDSDALAQQLASLQIESDELLSAAGFSAADLEQLTKQFDAMEVDAPDLESGDREPFRRMAFVLHDRQHEVVERAIKTARNMGHGDAADNENRNGNALAFICEEFNRANG